MERYELLYILQPTFTDDEVAAAAGKVSALLQGQAATITQEVDLGKKRLAYPIKKAAYGYYRLVEFSAEPTGLKKVNELLTLAPDVLRHLVVAKPVKSQATIERSQALRARLAARRQQRAVEYAPAGREAEPTAAPSLSADELEKKLERILDETPSV
jgi:small subunit ribosomal protein S6